MGKTIDLKEDYFSYSKKNIETISKRDNNSHMLLIQDITSGYDNYIKELDRGVIPAEKDVDSSKVKTDIPQKKNESIKLRKM